MHVSRPRLLPCFFLTVLLTSLSAAPSRAQDGTPDPPKKKTEMNVDMPDETEETDLVDRGQVQLETAVLCNRFRDGKPSVIGQALLRYGLSDRVEVRALLEDGRRRDQYLTETVQSTYPLAVGTKIVLLKDKPVLPDITFVGYVKLPATSRSREQAAYWSPIALLAFQHQFAGDKIKLEYNAGVQQDAFDTDWQELVNASFHYKLTQRLEAFAEYYAQFNRGEEPQHNLGGGLALEIGNRVEVYVSGGSTLRYEAANQFVAGGIAFRTL